MPIAYLLTVLAALTPAQWISLLSLIPQFVKLAEDAEPVVKQGVALFVQAVHRIKGLKAAGVPHDVAIRTTQHETQQNFQLFGFTDAASEQFWTNVGKNMGFTK